MASKNDNKKEKKYPITINKVVKEPIEPESSIGESSLIIIGRIELKQFVHIPCMILPINRVYGFLIKTRAPEIKTKVLNI